MRTGSKAHLAMDREVLNQYALPHALYMIIKSAVESELLFCDMILENSQQQG